MGVTVAVPYSVVRAIPDPVCVVAQEDALVLAIRCIGIGHLQHVDILDPDEEILDLVDLLIVVAQDQMDTAIQPSSQFSGITMAAEGEITHIVHIIIGSDNSVPVGDDDLVHLLDGGKWSLRVLDDSLMEPMDVRCEEDCHIAMVGSLYRSRDEVLGK